MLFDPSSTFETVLENAAFIRRTLASGVAPVPFSRTLPYAGTTLEEDLRASGRLRDTGGHVDYSFQDPRVDAWYAYLLEAYIRHGASGSTSLLEQLKWARFEAAVLRRFHGSLPGLDDYASYLGRLTAHYNDVYCHIVEDSAPHFVSRRPGSLQALEAIQATAEQHWRWLEGGLARAAVEFLRPHGFAVTGSPSR